MAAALDLLFGVLALQNGLIDQVQLKVVDDNPDRYSEPVELGGTHNRIGWLLFGTGHMDEALEEFEAARAVFQKLVDSFAPQYVHRSRSELANVLIKRASGSGGVGRPKTAFDRWHNVC